MLLPAITYYPLGDTAIVLEFGQSIAETTNALIRQVCKVLGQLQTLYPAISEYVPAFTTVTVYYDPLQFAYNALLAVLQKALSQVSGESLPSAEEKEIPVWYNGPDLDAVAQHTGLDQDSIIQLHTANIYRVHMLGFVPGFPYLGGMDKRLSTPRMQTPRLQIPAGSVGIAGEQTGVYPIETPGGWQIIGQTPLRLFVLNRAKPSYLAMGDRLRFVAITEAEFQTIKANQDGD